MSETKNMTVRNIPEELLKEIKKQAAKNLRSMNNEIISILQKGVK